MLQDWCIPALQFRGYFIKMLHKLCLFTALCALPAAAVPFSLQFTWTPVAGFAGNSGDQFAFQFTDSSGELQITELKVTLGAGMIYDLTNTGPGYLTYGAYAVQDGGAGSALTGAPIGEGLAGNRTLSWDMTSFVDGVTFGYTADVDEDRTCASGFAGLLCRGNADSILPSGFIERGGVDVEFTVAFINGANSKTFSSLSSCQCWDPSLFTASTTYDGVLDTPEPATWMLGIGGLALCVLRRRIK
jgi:hypothetical protein